MLHFLMLTAAGLAAGASRSLPLTSARVSSRLVMSSPAPEDDGADAPQLSNAKPIDFNAAFAERAKEVAAQDAVDMGRMASLVGNELKSTLDSINGAIDPSLRPRASDAQLKAKGLLSTGEWDATVLALGTVVVLAILSQISFSGGTGQIGLQAEPGAYIR